MSRRGDEFSTKLGGARVRQRSGWLIPLAVFVLTAGLSAAMLVFYLAPSAPELVEEQPAPTDSTSIVALNVGGQSFHIPASYLPYASARKGGARQEVSVELLLPDLAGYTLGEADAFASNAKDSRLLNILIRADRTTLPEQERFDRIYKPLFVNENGTQALYGLTKYNFRPESGYHNEELFVGQGENGPVMLRCTVVSPVAPAPSCLREMPLASGLSFSYRFKRVHLERWREIDADLHALVGSMMDKT
jgi:hypothetical protein